MFSSLSDKQKAIVFCKSGKFVVWACPGSGKTYSVAARLAHRTKNWKHKRKGIAALSFTNVAWQNIGQELKNTFRVQSAIRYPHFLGTLDSFINQHIFLPFGHLIMNCKKRPVLVGDPHSSWSYCSHEKCYEQYFDIVSYNIDDSLLYPEMSGAFFFGYSKIYKNDGTESKHALHLRDAKKRFWCDGYANQADANYFTVKILEKYPAIAKALVARFNEFIIDEAQDTTEVQMRLLDLLIENGLDEVILIGDPDQAIFEWNNAKPELFIQKYNEWKDNSIELDENRRSSQIICDFTVKLRSLPNTTCAINDEVKDFGMSPEIMAYDHNNAESIKMIIESFLRICKSYDIKTNPQDIAVLVRSGNFIDTIQQGESSFKNVENPWIAGDVITREVVKAKYFLDNKSCRDGYKLIEQVLIKALLKIKHCLREDIRARIDEIGFIQHRKEVYRLASILPKIENDDINQWITKARSVLDGSKLELRIKNGSDAILIKYLFRKEKKTPSPDEHRLGTVHSVKGETFDAVLLLLKKKGAKGSYYKTLLNNGKKTMDDEELRIVYVAITRPRKLLMLAVPKECYQYWNNSLYGRYIGRNKN